MLPSHICPQNTINPSVGTRFLLFDDHKNSMKLVRFGLLSFGAPGQENAVFLGENARFLKTM